MSLGAEMALIGNYSVLQKLPVKFLAGNNTTQNYASMRSNFSQPGRVRNWMMQSETVVADQFYAVPDGSYPSVSWIIPQKAGRIASRNQIYGNGTLTPGLLGGRSAVASLTGAGDISTATASLLAALIADLSGAGDISSSSLIATLLLAGDLTGSGDITALLGSLAAVQANLTGAGTVSLVPFAIGTLAADITGVSELSPQNLAAAVWSALASQYNDAGTMGNKLNSAGAAADPWTVVLDGVYTAGDLMRLMSAALAGELAGAPAGPIEIQSVNGSTIRITAIVDANGNRTGVTYNVS